MSEAEVGFIIIGALFVASEALAEIKSVRENSVFQVITSILRRIVKKGE